MNPAAIAVAMVKVIRARPTEVFSAWIDPRVGGRYRIAVTGPDGDVHVTTGEYLELVPGKRLVKTWVYEGPHPVADRHATVVTVDFREIEGGLTELTLRHDRLATDAGCELTRSGWAACLEALAVMHAGGLE